MAETDDVVGIYDGDTLYVDENATDEEIEAAADAIFAAFLEHNKETILVQVNPDEWLQWGYITQTQLSNGATFQIYPLNRAIPDAVVKAEQTAAFIQRMNEYLDGTRTLD